MAIASTLFLCISVLVFNLAHSAFVGVNYGTLANNLPPPSVVANFLKTKTYVNHVKLFDANPDVIRAFANTQISLVITVPNGLIPSFAGAQSVSVDWVKSNVVPFYPSTNITLILLGNEVMYNKDKNQIAHLVPALWKLNSALKSLKLTHIRVSTPHSLGILVASNPPSTGRFRRVYDRVIFAPLLDYHRKTKTAFIVNPYPYFGYSHSTIDFAMFKKNAGVHDARTGKTYTNMFDYLMDAVHSAAKRLGYGDVEIAVGETGWPSKGKPGQFGVSSEDARTYNTNLLKHVNSGKGTPLMPNRNFDTYIFALFNENLKPGPIAERNWGLFNADLTPVYDAGIMRVSYFLLLFYLLVSGDPSKFLIFLSFLHLHLFRREDGCGCVISHH